MNLNCMKYITAKEAEEKGCMAARPYRILRGLRFVLEPMVTCRASCVGQRGKLRPIDLFCEKQIESSILHGRQDFLENHGPYCLGRHEHMQALNTLSCDAIHFEVW